MTCQSSHGFGTESASVSISPQAFWSFSINVEPCLHGAAYRRHTKRGPITRAALTLPVSHLGFWKCGFHLFLFCRQRRHKDLISNRIFSEHLLRYFYRTSSWK